MTGYAVGRKEVRQPRRIVAETGWLSKEMYDVKPFSSRDMMGPKLEDGDRRILVEQQCGVSRVGICRFGGSGRSVWVGVSMREAIWNGHRVTSCSLVLKGFCLSE